MRDVTASVGIRRGVQCRNRVVDQQTVLGLLDQIPAGQGGNAGIDLEWMPPREGGAGGSRPCAAHHGRLAASASR